MNESTRKKIVYGALVLTIIWGIYNFPFRNETKVEQPRPAAALTLAATATVPTASDLIDIEEKTQSEWGTDPFRLVKQVRPVVKRKQVWHLSGIVYNNQIPLAIINNRSVGIGDIIDQAQVVDIGRKKVTLKYGGQLVTLTVT